ncbi:DEAD/DEAH box helicase [Clostridium sp. AF32-12BH]|uniref:DEAD/DEAH box helicase n=1 Tax=Clostridium sp. AF32-12BH TaxID=2292006 RepID=UPI0015F9071B|nr:DEAD/DEAH box helicase [Clostridium sp. AF32-12BH]
MKIMESATSTFWKGEQGIQASVQDGDRLYKVNLYVKGSQVRDYSCSCVNGNSYKGMCAHAKLVWEQWKKEQELHSGRPVSTSQEIRTMIREYTNREVAKIIEDSEETEIRLVPRLMLKNGSASLEFKLGRDRFYIIKDLMAFAEAVRTGASVSYGKQLTFHHSLNAFAQEDRELCALLLELVQVYQEHFEQFRKSSFVTMQGLRTLNLNRANRDRFFQLMENRQLEVEFGDGSHVNVKVQQECMRLPVQIRRAGRDGIAVSVDQELFGIPGERGWYVGDQTRLVCLDETESRELGVFLEQVLKDKKSHTLDIQDRDIPLFYERVLQKILPYAELTVTDVDLESYRPKELKAQFSFDSTGPDEITMKPLLSYGDFSFSPLNDDKVPRIICRDVPAEFKISQVITKYFQYRDGESEFLVIRGDEDALYRLLSEGMDEFMSLGQVLVTDAARKIRVLPSPQVKVGVQTSGRWLELNVDAEGMSRSELLDILAGYDPKKKYYRLKNGEFLDVGENGLMTVARMTDSLGIGKEELLSGTVKVPVYRALYLDSVLKEGNGITFYRDNLFRAVVRGMKSVEDSDYAVPDSLKQVLRGYQKTGYRWLKTLDVNGFGGILADDMGLGKTIQIITLLQAEAKTHPDSQTLIVCPASLVYNWENELKRFAPGLTVQTVTGTAPEREEILRQAAEVKAEVRKQAAKAAEANSMESATGAALGNLESVQDNLKSGQENPALESVTAICHPQILITSYDLLKRDIAFYEPFQFRFQVIDEAQYIKNPLTQSAKSVKLIKAQTRYALTGTPIENRLSELWSIFDYLMPGFLFTYSRFRKQFETPIAKDGNLYVLENLRRLSGPFVLRRLKKDVLKDLPDKLETVVYSMAEEEQKQLYTAHALALKEELEQMSGDTYGSERIQVLAELTKLRQICCDPSLCFDRYKGGSAKLDTCMELITGGIAGGHKILLFSQFTSMLELIGARLKKEGIAFHELTGATPKEERIRMAGAFQTDDTPVFLISLKAGGTGLNLTAADVVIHYDPWWNVAAQNQATDRAHRIGQEKQVSVFKLIMKDTVEENILKLQEQKRDLADQIISGEQVSIGSLSKEELLKILSPQPAPPSGSPQP